MTDIVLFGAILPAIGYRITSGSFPIGLLALSSALKEEGFSVEVISGAVQGAESKLRDSLESCRYFGVSSMTGPYLKAAIDVSKAVKRKYPHMPIIWGGVHPTLLPEETVRQDYVDIIVRGPGEETLPLLLNTLDKGLSLDRVKGITYKSKGRIISNPDIDMCDINNYPGFDYSSFIPYKDKINEIPYISSRGCPYGCSFCVASKLYQHRYYYYPAERVFNDIKNLVSVFKTRRIIFWDDNFFVIKERARKLCNLILDNNIKIEWSAFCHCDLFLQYEDGLISLMKESGLRNISFGAESGSIKILNSIKKGIRPSDIIDCVKKARKFMINSDFSFMTGFPHENINDFAETINLFRGMLKIDPDVSIRLFAFTPYPKIPLLEERPELLKYLPKTIEGWADLTYQTYIPKWLSREHQKLIDDIVWMANFLSRKQRLRTKNRLIDFFLYLYHLSAIVRLQHNYFLFAFEWKIFKLFYGFRIRLSQKKYNFSI